jgi:hypothetical protein
MKFARTMAVLLWVCCLVSPGVTLAVTFGQIDTFENGTTQNWTVALGPNGSHPAPPANIPNGGPAGANDNYLLLTATGSPGAGGRLTVINPSQWAGNYLTAGVTAISMDVYNLGNSDLALRLLFEDPAGGPPTNMAFSTTPILVPAGSGWVSVAFPITTLDLTALIGGVTPALTNATDIRLFHNDLAGFPGPEAATLLGVDNIAAVPAPPAALLLTTGLAGLWFLRRK